MGALHEAAYNGDLDKVRECLNAGADPNSRDKSGFTPLHWVAFRALVGWSPVEVTRFLLEAGADVNAPTSDEIGNTPLLFACKAGSERVARTLIDAGANVNVRCGNTTPLIAAAMTGVEGLVRLLLNLGADATVLGPFRMTAQEWAESNGFEDVVETIRSRP